MPKMSHRSRKKDSRGKEIERRRAPRLSSEDISALKSTRLLAGPEVRLMNLSKRGALLQSDTRIAPGAKVCVRMIAGDTVILLRGFVLRSRVSQLKGATLTYEWAIAFDEECSLFDNGEESLQATEDANAAVLFEEAAKTSSENWMAAGGGERPDLIMVTIPVTKSGSAACRSETGIERPGACGNSNRA